jgi:cyclopropane-fatty-acyl-phospholipid synthase
MQKKNLLPPNLRKSSTKKAFRENIFINKLILPSIRMYKKIVTEILKNANIKIGEDIIINDESFYKELVLRGSLGLGETYMSGKWDSQNLDTLVTKFLESKLDTYKVFGAGINLATFLKSKFDNLQDVKHAPDLYDTHYNSGNYLFESFLDPNMIYTCAYFKNTDDLAQAQLNKIRIVGEKLDLKPGDKVLDIGCGWGGTAKILSDMFDVHVTGVADTPNQIAYAKEHNLSDKVDFILTDYRDVEGKYDKIYNVGFLEAVGPKNLRNFMEQVDMLLKDEGIFLTHTIGGKKSVRSTEPWIDRYIFPHGVIPSMKQIDKATSGIFEKRDFESFGKYYVKTLTNWNSRFNANWDKIKDEYKNPEVFKRMMNYYFLTCAASFKTGKNDLWHFVYTKPGRVKDYEIYRLP